MDALAWEELAKWAVGGVRQAKNLQRRHLSESQRAMVAAKIAKMKQGTRTDIEPRMNSYEVSADDAAKQLHIDRDSVFKAKKVLTEGTPKP